MVVRRFAALLAAAAVLAGCGQKGPLYLPDKGGQVVTRPGGGQTQQQAPQSQAAPQSQTTPAPATPTDDQKKKDPQTPRN
jgi:predicted small lipoprotein YifL